MGKRDEYLANAAECQRMVNVTPNPDERRMWQGMKESWLRMANNRARESARRPPDANRSAAP
jgi:hypothetical protein